MVAVTAVFARRRVWRAVHGSRLSPGWRKWESARLGRRCAGRAPHTVRHSRAGGNPYPL